MSECSIHDTGTIIKISLYFRLEFSEGQLYRKSGLHVLWYSSSWWGLKHILRSGMNEEKKSMSNIVFLNSYSDIQWNYQFKTIYKVNNESITLVCYYSDTTQNALFFRRSFCKFNSLTITEKREIYLIISISISIWSYQFPDVDYSKLQNLSYVTVSQTSHNIIRYQGLLYHRTCKPDFLSSWPSLNSYLE